ncbi:MAG: hypothetical protein ACE5H4_02595 [Candidatus Thorarchaeota archaeon]
MSALTIFTGYSQGTGWFQDRHLLSLVHRLFEIVFLSVLILHVGITLRFYGFNWRKNVEKVKTRRATSVHALRIIQRLSAILIVLFLISMVLPGLNGYEVFAQVLEDVVPFEFHRVFDVLLVSAIIIHVAVGIRFLMMRRRMKGPLVGVIVAGLAISLLFSTVYLDVARDTNPFPGGPVTVPTNGYTPDARVTIGASTYGFDSTQVTTVRLDIFRPGKFSVFDVLVHLANRSVVELEYHFDESMNTHVIDTLEGESNWWYGVIYSGGWFEMNAFRMDHYPWNEGTELRFMPEIPSRIDMIYSVFRNEVARLNDNNGQAIIPEVFISSEQVEIYGRDVVVTARNLRNDTFQDGVVTAIDVIMSLADQGVLTYELQWYDSIGDADVVRSYWVEAINGHKSFAVCGWVYESGSREFSRFFGNHIHLPSDVRVMNSPEYVEWF